GFRYCPMGGSRTKKCSRQIKPQFDKGRLKNRISDGLYIFYFSKNKEINYPLIIVRNREFYFQCP
ncbi:hypothetical protein, partial [Neisseria sp. P0009.S007]|uniref:hypothetical protein n=1 Tax=Neisseria sp. P0009.S007 TaxID=3436714 RepID=UPI003F7EC159